MEAILPVLWQQWEDTRTSAEKRFLQWFLVIFFWITCLDAEQCNHDQLSLWYLQLPTSKLPANADHQRPTQTSILPGYPLHNSACTKFPALKSLCSLKYLQSCLFSRRASTDANRKCDAKSYNHHLSNPEAILQHDKMAGQWVLDNITEPVPQLWTALPFHCYLWKEK